jgi:C4-type Zn-finger protein
MKKIGYCTNDSFEEEGKPCPKAVTKENQLALNPFITQCVICNQDLKIEKIVEHIPWRKKIITIVIICAGILFLGGLVFGIIKMLGNKHNINDNKKNSVVQPINIDTNKLVVRTDTNTVVSPDVITPKSPPLAEIQITVQPKDISACVGKNKVNFIVSATGKGHLKYQWRFNGTDISKENTSILKFNQVIAEDGGNYDVKISDQNGNSVISNQASLKISTDGQPPRILSQPKDYSICSGNSNIILSVEASGAQPLFYQWRFNGKDLPDNIGSSISLTNVNQSKAGNYDVVVSNQCGSITSKAARIYMPAAPHITSAPKDLNVEEGRTVVFNVSATGSSSLKYNWYLNGNQISNAGSKLQIDAFNQNKSGSYKIIVNDECGRKDEAAFYVDIKSSFSYRYQKAVDLYDSHQYDNAEIRFSGLLRERPADPFVNYMIGLCRVAVGNYDNATSEYFKRVITLKDYISDNKSCEILCKAKYYIAMCSYQQNNVPLKNIRRNFEDFVKYPCGCSSQKTEYDNANNILNHIGN